MAINLTNILPGREQQQPDKARLNNKYSDLEVRTTEFAKRVIRLCKILPRNTINQCHISQIIRSSGSIGANYREANEALGKRDFLMRLKICRKEAKETAHWLELIKEANNSLSIDGIVAELIQETIEFRNIFSSIIFKSS